MPSPNLSLMLLSTMLLTAAAVAAREKSRPLSEDDFFSELPVVLSVTRLETPVRDTPAAVTVINRRQIQASGIRDLAEVFRLVPGMQVGYQNGHVPTVTYHGFADQWSRGMQVLVDGRSVYSPGIGGVEWADLALSLDDIEIIEVIRGPNAATYGANSFTGVISITTSHPSQQTGTRIATRYGTNGIRDLSFRHAGSNGDLDYRSSVVYRSDYGFDGRYDDKQTRLFTARLDYQPNDRDQLEFQIGISASDKQDGFTGDPVQPIRSIDSRSNFQQLRWQRSWSDDQHSRMHFYHNLNQRSEPIGGEIIEFSPPLPPAFPLALVVEEDNNLTAERFDLEFQHTSSYGGFLRAVFGASLRQDKVTARFYLGTDKQLKNDVKRVFANFELTPVESLVFNVGAMREDNDITGADTSPRFAVNWHVLPDHTLRASVSEAKRTPGFLENQAAIAPLIKSVSLPIPAQRPFILFKGPGDLKPESIRSREIAYIGSWSDLNLDIDLRLFRDSIKDRIGTVNPHGQGITRQFANVDKATIHGWETQLHWQPNTDTEISGSYSRATNRSSTDTSKRIDASTPRHTASLLLDHRFDEQWHGSMAYYWISEHAWLGEGTKLDNSTDFDTAIRRLDLRLAKQFRFGGQKLNVSGVIQNALGDYVDFYHDNGNPERRNIFHRKAFINVSMEL